LFQYNQKVQKHDRQKPSPVFGSSKTEANLDPVDGIIGELVEQGTREFVSMFVPTQIAYKYELESSSNENSGEGVRKMRGRFYNEAIGAFNAAIAKESSDYKSMFCLGVCYEMTGKCDDAINYYRQAASAKGVDEKTAAIYQSAADRLGRHKARIARAGSGA
jgi:tetratricopeptide (TPR) repeat protein